MFLQTVAASTGINFLIGLVQSTTGDGRVFPLHRAVSFSDPRALAAEMEYIQARATDVYMALGSFGKDADNKPSRKAEHCKGLRSFWLDIDAGVTKFAKHGNAVYETQAQAVNALCDFVENNSFPMPTYIVSSGEGLHVYWAFTKNVPVSEWKPYAKALQKFTAERGLKVDPARTADAASILRVPGTTHSGSGNTVEILYKGSVYDFDALTPHLASHVEGVAPQVFDFTQDLPAYAAEAGISGINLTASTPKKFEKIIALERDESAGCAQIFWAYKNQQEVPEPMWRAVLSVAQYCDDGAEWIHKVSEHHPSYSMEETATKAAQCRGPYTCATFEQMRPEGCAQCPHRNRMVKSPIVLGLNPENMPTRVKQVNAETQEDEIFVIPSMPYPFYRKPHGGIYVKAKVRRTTPEGFQYEEEVEKCIWPYDFYITERVAETGVQRYWCRHHSPHDGVKEFELSSEDVANAGEGLYKVLYGNGIPIQKDMRDYMSRYIQTMVKQRVETAKAREAVHSIGWTKDDTFVLGDREFTEAGSLNAPVNSTRMASMFSRGMKRLAPVDAIDPLAEWNKLLADAYPNEYKTAVAGQFIICAAMGAPIAARFAQDDQRSGLINIYSDGTGHGKTMATSLACRVFATPSTLTTKGRAQGATINAFYEMLGYSQSIPLVRDEITEMSADELSDIAYTLVNGKTKIRMEGQRNDIREGEKYWGTYVFSTSNRSIVDSLVSKKGDATAQYSRVTEFAYPLPEWLDGDEGKARAARVARRAEEFVGVAGAPLIRWCVENYDTARQMYYDVYDMLSVMVKAPRNKARFWLNHAAGVVLGALVGEQLGLHPFNVEAIMDFAVKNIDDMWRRSEATAVTVDDALGELLAGNINNWLVLNQNMAPITSPHHDIKIRTEQATNRIWITQAAVTEYAARRERNATSLNNHIAQLGGVRKQKRMLSNTAFASGSNPQWAWEIDLSDPRAYILAGELNDNHSLRQQQETTGGG